MSSKGRKPSSNRPVKHHHVNKAYLKRFCENGQYHQYMANRGADDKVTFQWAGGNPGTTGYVEHLYDSPADTPNRCHVEAELTQIEKAGMKGIDSILASKPSSFDSRSEPGITTYIAAMAMRSPNAMQEKVQLEPLMNAGLVKGEYPNNPGAEGVLEDIKTVRPHLQSIQWHLYWFDGQDGRVLVTSDRPVGIYALAEVHPQTGGTLQPRPVEAGPPDSWAKLAICTFPLSPTCAAIGFKGTRRDLEHALNLQVGIDCDDRLPGWVNTMPAWQAERIYTADKGAKFLLPNPPEGPQDRQFTQMPETGIYVPQPRNQLGSIEELVVAANQFHRAHTVQLNPNNPDEFMTKVQALRRQGVNI